MAGQHGVWGLDLGQCALKAVKLTYDSKEDRAVAIAFDYIEHPKVLSQPDAEREELIRAAFEKFLSRNEVKDDPVYIAVPGQSGLARFVKLPPVDPKKVNDIVQFEARQQIPFPLPEVVWDFQRIGGEDPEEAGDMLLDAEVGIFAIKKDKIAQHMVPYQEMGIEVEAVQLSPVALYNFVAFDQFLHASKGAAAKAEAENAETDQLDGGDEAEGDEAKPAKPAKKATADEEEEEGDTVVILDIGADKTDVVVTDGDSIWLRNLPIGGNHFTRALTKDLKLTFAKAEHLKRNATKAPDAKKLYQAMRPVLQDFVTELQKSISYYMTTHRGAVVKKVLGVGNGFKLPGLQKFLEQNLQYKIEKINKFNGVTGDEVVKASAFADNLPGFCVAYGLALQGLHQTPIQTNLLPREIFVERLIRKKKPWSLTAVALLLLGFISIFWGTWRSYSSVHAETFKGPESQAKNAYAEFNKWKTDFDQAKANFNTGKTAGEDIVGMERVKNRLGWISVLKAINDVLPRRSQKTDDTDLEGVGEINIEYVDAAFFDNTAEWYNALDDNAKRTAAPEDVAAPPSNPGWVFQVLGYTFHGQHELFVLQQILNQRFQAKELRAAGISHAVLRVALVDPNWAPSKGSPLAKMERMDRQGRAAKALGRIPLGEQVVADPQEAPPSDVPEDWTAYQQEAAKTAQAAQPVTLLRTDFAIQFIWKPVDPMAAAGTAAAPATP